MFLSLIPIVQTWNTEHITRTQSPQNSPMGAAASADEKGALQAAYQKWDEATSQGDITDEKFVVLLQACAPVLHARVTAADTGLQAARALQSQFRTMGYRLRVMKDAQASSTDPDGAIERKAPDSDPTSSAPASAPPALQKMYSWAEEKSANLQRGLAKGMLQREPLRLLDLKVADVRISALVDTGAEKCAMSAASAERCGLRPLVDESFGGLSGGMGVVTKHGRVHYAQMGATCADGTTIQLEVAVDVMQWPAHAHFDAILGIDFLIRYRAVIDVCDSSLSLYVRASDVGASPSAMASIDKTRVKVMMRKEIQ